MSSNEVFFCIAIFINFVCFYYCLFSLLRRNFKLEERIIQLEKIAQRQQDINGIQIELNKSFNDAIVKLEKIAQRQQDINGIQIELNESFNDAIVKGESGPEFFPTISCINIEWPEKK